jgi:hypothetical protein
MMNAEQQKETRRPSVSVHVDIERLKALMLTQGKLTEQEGDHLFLCAECKQAMIDATLQQIKIDSESKKFDS